MSENFNLEVINLLEEVNIQKKMLETLLERVLLSEARYMALSELLVVNDVIDEATVEALEQENYKELLLEQLI